MVKANDDVVTAECLLVFKEQDDESCHVPKEI